MRAYCWGNFYLSSIQQGIQSAHAIVEMFTKFPPASPQGTLLHEWAKDHKTMIVLAGGNSADLHRRYQSLALVAQTLGLPSAVFCEDEASLNGAITCITCIIPEEFYAPISSEETRDLRDQIATHGYESALEASFDHEVFDPASRLRLLMLDCRLAS